MKVQQSEMTDTFRYFWAKDRPGISLPESGLLVEERRSEISGALGFRPGIGGCVIWFESSGRFVDWPELIERITIQARKSKYSFAVVDCELPVPEDLRAALELAGFTGEPPARALRFDAPDDLQPYLDWSGRVTSLAQGKGSESINAKLYGVIAANFPAEGHYSEVQVNEILNRHHLFGDPAGVRRELVDRGYIARTRDCRDYWKVEDPIIIGRT